MRKHEVQNARNFIGMFSSKGLYQEMYYILKRKRQKQLLIDLNVLRWRVLVGVDILIEGAGCLETNICIYFSTYKIVQNPKIIEVF